MSLDMTKSDFQLTRDKYEDNFRLILDLASMVGLTQNLPKRSSSETQTFQDYLSSCWQLTNTLQSLVDKKCDVYNRNQQKNVFTLLDDSEFQKNTKVFDKIESHLRTVLDNKTTVLEVVQSESEPEFPPTHISYHRDVMNVFLLMADWITHLETRLATITHLQKSFKTMREQDLEVIESLKKKLLAKIHIKVNRIKGVEQVVNHFYHAKCSDEHLK